MLRCKISKEIRLKDKDFNCSALMLKDKDFIWRQEHWFLALSSDTPQKYRIKTIANSKITL